MNAKSRCMHIFNNLKLPALCIKQQDDWLGKTTPLSQLCKIQTENIKICMSPFILSQKSRYHGNNVEGYAPMFSACCLFLTLPLPARASNVCRHGDRLFHLVNMMWHVSSCTSQEMTGDWFILLPTQTMNDDTVKKKLRSQYQKGQFQVLYLKRKKSSLSKTLSDALFWLIFTNMDKQWLSLWLFSYFQFVSAYWLQWQLLSVTYNTYNM